MIIRENWLLQTLTMPNSPTTARRKFAGIFAQIAGNNAERITKCQYQTDRATTLPNAATDAPAQSA